MSLISLITLVRNFISMDPFSFHSIFFFLQFSLNRYDMFYKKNKRSMRKHLILFAFLWFNFHGAFRVCVTPPKWKQLIPQFGFVCFFFKSDVRFQMKIKSRCWRLVDIKLDVKFQQKGSLNEDRLYIVLNKTRLRSFVNIAW